MCGKVVHPFCLFGKGFHRLQLHWPRGVVTLESPRILLVGAGGIGGVIGSLLSEMPTTPDFDWVLLAVQPPQVEQAARSARAALAARGQMVCFQNGLCEERVAEIVGPDRVVGGVVAWGASMVEPGLYER